MTKSLKTLRPFKLQTFKLTITYLGSDFYGWQRQDPHPTVQLALETALKKIYGKSFHVAGSGRTDRGVHALGQVASCILPANHPPATLLRALNFHPPPGVEKGEWGNRGVEEEIDGWRVTGGGPRVTNNAQPATFWVSRKDAKARRREGIFVNVNVKVKEA